MINENGGGRPQDPAPTPQEKIAAFGVPVVVAENIEDATDPWVGLDRIDGYPIFLDIIYRDRNLNRLLQVRNVRNHGSKGPRIDFGDVERTTLSEFLLNNNHFHQPGDDGRQAQRARSQTFLESLRAIPPTVMTVTVDSSDVVASAVSRDGFTAVQIPVPTGQVVVVAADEEVRRCRLRTKQATD